MFKIDFIVEDKHLAKVLYALAGFHVLNLSSVPVLNAKVDGGKVKQDGPAGSVKELVFSEFSKEFEKGTIIKPADLKTVVEKCGASSSSTSYFTSALMEQGLLKRMSKRGTYKVI